MRATDNLRNYFFWTLNALLGVAFIVELFVPRWLSWMDAAAIVLAAAASIAALNRQLPLQNVLPAALITAVLGGLAHAFSARTAIPFGPLAFDFPMSHAQQVLNSKTEITLNPVIYQNHGGSLLFGTVPWMIPLLWVVVIFSARGVGRLILRPWRKVKNYGYSLIGVTAVLVVAFDFALEPFAVGVKHFWHWQHTKIHLTWFGASPLNFIGWGFVALLVLMFITPSLIRKQPGSSSAPDFHPLFVWLGALLVFGVGSASAGLWWSVGADAVIAGVTTFFAIRGAKW